MADYEDLMSVEFDAWYDMFYCHDEGFVFGLSLFVSPLCCVGSRFVCYGFGWNFAYYDAVLSVATVCRLTHGGDV